VGKKWYDTIPQISDEIKALEHVSWNKEQRQFPANVINLVSKAKHAKVHEKDKLENEKETKKAVYLGVITPSHSFTLALRP
jgi:DNA recombination-dependent growth factor C